jgi:hypothetical protein
MIFPEALYAHTQAGRKADQFCFKTLRSQGSKKKADHKTEHQNGDGSDNQTGN